MSAESNRKQTKQGFNGQIVLPQAVSDPSIIESVAGFIHEVVPQAYSSVLPGETRESITWARFESTDFNDPENYPQVAECESESIPPLLLVLGYGTGVQVWSIAGSGDATEVLSWCQGSVRTLRLLNKPRDNLDPYENKRPLVAIVDSAGPGPQYCTVNFVSLKTAEVIKSIKFKNPICDIYCNRKSLVITFVEKIAIFNVATFEDRMTITTCYPSPGIHSNPVALGHRWLAYAEKRLTTWQRSSGGCEGDGAQSYTATAIHAVKTLGKGLRDLSGSLTGNVPQPINNNTAQPGVVTIVDIETKPTKEDDSDNIIAHFVAHVGPVVAMTFDSSGLLLITADKHGHRFHVFRVHPHPVSSQLAAVHHLYVLHRGETTARVQDITVSWDSRWVAVSSVRGTTHVFPITPYGGAVTVRTHTTPNVVNRLSRFERSAGLSDGRGSPLLEMPSQPLNPRLPPYPHPTTLSPLAQLRRTPAGEESPLAASFASARAWIPGKPRGKKPIVESLFVISSGGTLIQYDLDPKCIPGVPKDKISYDTGIELGVEAKAEWSLLKPPYSSSIQPPLALDNPLLANKVPSKPDHTTSNDDRWLSQVEIVTHTGPHRRLWMGPQFSFKSIDPLPPSEGDAYNENMNPVRSNPVNMPHRPYLLIEGGSGGSIDSPHLTGYGSGSEDMGHGESRLREDLADAMMEPATQNTGFVGGVRLKAALLERQVNPLGTVITLPSNEQLLHHQQQHHHHVHTYLPPVPTPDIVLTPSTSQLKVDYEDILDSKDSNISLDRGVFINPNNANTLSASIPETATVSAEYDQQTLSTSDICSDQIIIEDVPKMCEKEVVTKIDVITEKLLKYEGKTSKSKKKKSKAKQKFDMSRSVDTLLSVSDSKLKVLKCQVSTSESSDSDCLGKVESETLETDSVSKGETSEEIIETSLELNSKVVKDVHCFETDIEGKFCSETSTFLQASDPQEGIEDFVGDSESISDPITAVAISRDISETDMRSEIGESLEYTHKETDHLILFESEEEYEQKDLKSDDKENENSELDSEGKDLLLENEVIEVEIDDEKIEPNEDLIDDSNDELASNVEVVQETYSTDDYENTLTTESQLKVDSESTGPGEEAFLDQEKKNIGSKVESSEDNKETVDFMELLEKRRKCRISKRNNSDLLYEPIKIKQKPSYSVEESGVSSSNNEEEFMTDTSSGKDIHAFCDPEAVDIKKSKRDRSRKLKSTDLSESEVKNKSPSPAKSDAKPDTDSSDEAFGKNSETKSNIMKQPKRKRGKKSDEHSFDIQPEIVVEREQIKIKTKTKSEGTVDIEKSDYETCSEKKSDSSLDSSDFIKKISDSNGNFQETKPCTSICTITKEPLKPTNSAEDRDSVYESCNDEEFSALEHANSERSYLKLNKDDFVVPTPFESSKDFEIAIPFKSGKEDQEVPTPFESSKEDFEVPTPFESSKEDFEVPTSFESSKDEFDVQTPFKSKKEDLEMPTPLESSKDDFEVPTPLESSKDDFKVPTPFESSKEDFEVPTPFKSGKENVEVPNQEVTITESSSSNTEDRTDSAEKDGLSALSTSKKMRKQKKKRR